jgi:hypothetical protein
MPKKTTSSMKELGRNVRYEMDGDDLVIRIRTTAKGEPSGSGKTNIIATTQGNKQVAGGFLGLNFYQYADKKR